MEDKIVFFLCFYMNGIHSGKHMQSIDSFAHEHVKWWRNIFIVSTKTPDKMVIWSLDEKTEDSSLTQTHFQLNANDIFVKWSIRVHLLFHFYFHLWINFYSFMLFTYAESLAYFWVIIYSGVYRSYFSIIMCNAIFFFCPVLSKSLNTNNHWQKCAMYDIS